MMAMPRTRARVVCTFGETMLTLAPTRRFTSVDLPTLGEPRIATNPQRLALASCSASGASTCGSSRLLPEDLPSRFIREPNLHQHHLRGSAFGQPLRRPRCGGRLESLDHDLDPKNRGMRRTA